MAAGAECTEATSSQVIENGFSHDASGRVTSAQKKYVVLGHLDNLSAAKNRGTKEGLEPRKVDTVDVDLHV
jgi:hypothetical protein